MLCSLLSYFENTRLNFVTRKKKNKRISRRFWEASPFHRVSISNVSDSIPSRLVHRRVSIKNRVSIFTVSLDSKNESRFHNESRLTGNHKKKHNNIEFELFFY